jgi:Tat protein secretion system quality control protein TatD with DNase activity
MQHADPKRLLLTDAPYLAKKRTEVYKVATKASQLMKISLEEFMFRCNQNACKSYPSD